MLYWALAFLAASTIGAVFGFGTTGEVTVIGQFWFWAGMVAFLVCLILGFTRREGAK